MRSCCDHRICDHSNQIEGRSNKFTQLSRNISWKSLDQNISGDNDWVLRIFHLLCLCLHFLLLQVLLCDLCNSQWHMSCLKIPLTHVPEGQWQCPDCSPDLCDGPGRTKLLTERYVESFNPWGNGFYFILSASELSIQLRSRIEGSAARWIYYKVAAEWTETLLSWVLL